MTTLTQVQINTSLVVLENISFQGSLNGITTNTFSFLSGLTGYIQNQINAISNTTPVGSVISFAGNASSLPGYLKCDGNLYSIASYPNLYNAIGTIYGGDSNQGWFNVPNYQGIFLRGAGNQTLDLEIPSNPLTLRVLYKTSGLLPIFARFELIVFICDCIFEETLERNPNTVLEMLFIVPVTDKFPGTTTVSADVPSIT